MKTDEAKRIIGQVLNDVVIDTVGEKLDESPEIASYVFHVEFYRDPNEPSKMKVLTRTTATRQAV